MGPLGGPSWIPLQCPFAWPHPLLEVPFSLSLLVQAGICSTEIYARFTNEKTKAHRGHLWPGQGGIAWTGLPQTPPPPSRPQGHLLGDLTTFLLSGSLYGPPPSHPCSFRAWQGLCHHGDTRNPRGSALLYEWPIAAVTNHHQLGGVNEPHLCLPFWRSRVQHGPAELRARCQGAAFLPRLQGDWSLAFPASGGRPHSFLHRHSQ